MGVRLASPLAFLYLLPLALWSEGRAVHDFFRTRFVGATGDYSLSLVPRSILFDPLVQLLIASGTGAFFLNSLSFLASKHTEPLTMTVAASTKQVVTIASAAWLFATQLNSLNIIGIIIALCSALAY